MANLNAKVTVINSYIFANANLFLKLTRHIDDYIGVINFKRQRARPWVICADGFKVSIQAGRGLYCNPREDYAEQYKTVELGYPNMAEELLNPYAEDPDMDYRGVYSEVPVEIVDKILAKHGGIVDVEEH